MKTYGQTPGYLKNFAAFSDQASFDAMYNMIPQAREESVHLVDAMAGIGLVGKNIALRIREQRRQSVAITFVDISDAMLTHGSYDEKDVRICADIQDTGLPTESADLITCRCGLNNLTGSAWEPAITEIMRIIRSGGTLVLQDHLPLTEQQRVEMDALERFIAVMDGRIDEPTLKTLDEVEKIISLHGGKISKVETIPYRFDIRKRLKAKGILTECIMESDVTYPISTIGVQKL